MLSINFVSVDSFVAITPPLTQTPEPLAVIVKLTNMKIKLTTLILFILPLLTFGQKQKVATEEFKEDFNFFWNSIDETYCYFNKKQTDWLKVKEIYLPIIDTIKTKEQFITVLEKVFYELYDHHASLDAKTDYSQRVVPTRTDIWAEFINEKAIITEVRKNYGPEITGVIAGMEVVAVNDILIEEAIKPFVGKSLKTVDKEAKSFALRLLLAGNHISARKFTLKYNGVTKEYFPDANGLKLENIKYNSKIESKIIDKIGYIKINNCLFDNQLIPEFDSVMQNMQNTKSLILDLRETPSGGNTTVARAILSWFIDKDYFYQKHELYVTEKTSGIKRSWVEIVSPRQGKYYNKPLIVLANHWTGSVGEGITIAFDGIQRAKTVGTALARLNGAVYSFEMPNTKIGFSFPIERLYHINGTPREFYEPTIIIDYTKFPSTIDNDPVLDRALEQLK